jgi:hypothetical protein
MVPAAPTPCDGAGSPPCLRGMSNRRGPAVVNRLPHFLGSRGMSWGELARRTLLPPRRVARLRAPAANPRLAVAERVAAALGVTIERLWGLPRARRR